MPKIGKTKTAARESPNRPVKAPSIAPNAKLGGDKGKEARDGRNAPSGFLERLTRKPLTRGENLTAMKEARFYPEKYKRWMSLYEYYVKEGRLIQVLKGYGHA